MGGESILFVLTAKAISLEDSAFFLDFPLDCVLFAYFPFLQKCITFATFSPAPYHFVSSLFSLFSWYRRVLLAYYLDNWWKSILLVRFLITKTGQWVSEVAQSCLTLCNLMDYSLPGSSVHGILQARTLEWVAISFSRYPPDPGIESKSPTLQADALHSEPPGKPKTGQAKWNLLHYVII